MPCPSCGLAQSVAIGADGQPVDFDASFRALALMQWFAAARAAMASGKPGIALGVCTRCASPLLASSHAPVTLPCPHCAHAVTGEAAELLVDQWPEPWARVEGGGLSLEYRVAIVDDRTGVTAGCAACGLATPPNDPSCRCPRCNAVTWVARGAGDDARRVQLGVRVDGTRAGRPFSQLVSIVQGEMMLRTDAAAGSSAESGKSILGLTGIGCAIAVGLTLLVIFGISVGVFFATRR